MKLDALIPPPKSKFDFSGMPRATSMAFPDRPQTAREWGRYSHIMLRSLVTKEPPVCEWEADPTPAIERFGIKLPVTVRRVDYLRHQGRCGVCRSSETGHQIDLSNGMTQLEASASIWHELKHAQQIEKMGMDGYYFYYSVSTDMTTWLTYAQSPLEREAYLAMNLHFVCPLTRPL